MLFILSILLNVSVSYPMTEEVIKEASREHMMVALPDLLSGIHDPYEALNEVGKLIGSLPTHEQQALLQQFLIEPAFASHVETLLDKVRPLFNTVTVSTLQHDLALIQRVLLNKLVPCMVKFVCNRFTARYDWRSLQETTIAELKVSNKQLDLEAPNVQRINFVQGASLQKNGGALEAPAVYLAQDPRDQSWTLADKPASNMQSKQRIIFEISQPIPIKYIPLNLGGFFGLPEMKSEQKYTLKFEKDSQIVTTLELDASFMTSVNHVKRIVSDSGFRRNVLYNFAPAPYYSWFEKLVLDDVSKRLGDSMYSYQILAQFSPDMHVAAIGVTHHDIEDRNVLAVYLWYYSGCKSTKLIPFFHKEFYHTRQYWFQDFWGIYVPDRIALEKIEFSHNGKLLALCSNYGFCLQKVDGKEVILEVWKKNQERDGVITSCFSRDDMIFVVANINEDASRTGPQTVHFYDTRTRDRLFYMIFRNTGTLTALSFSPDDLWLILAFGKKLCAYKKNEFREAFIKKAGVSNEEMNRDRVLRMEMIRGDDLKASKLILHKTGRMRRLDEAKKFLDRNKRLKEMRTLNESSQKSTLEQVVPSCEPVLQMVREICNCENDNRVCTYLVIDGEGMQALMSAVMLKKLEERVNCRIHQLFDCIVGSSCGSILALGLVASKNNVQPLLTTEKLINLFYKRGNEIFPRNQRSGNLYSQAAVAAILHAYFKNVPLSDALTKVLVPSLDCLSQGRIVFDSKKAQKREEDDYMMADIALAAAADQSYFASPYITNVAKSMERSFAASILYKNNAAALILDKIAHARSKRVLVLHMTPGIVNEANSATQEAFTKLKDEGILYCRLKPIIESANIGKPDDVNPDLLERYIASAQRALDGNEVFIRRLVENKDQKQFEL